MLEGIASALTMALHLLPESYQKQRAALIAYYYSYRRKVLRGADPPASESEKLTVSE
jgi:hypothetical protein